MSTLLRSQVECPECHALVASIHRHDFRYCPCGETAIDGGRDYMRLMGNAIVGRMPEMDRSIRVAEDLSNDDAAKALATLNGLAKIAPHDKPRAACSLTMVNNSVAANVIWPARGKVGLPKDHMPARSSTKEYLDLLMSNGLARRNTTGNNGRYRHTYQALVELAEHPDVP